MTPVWHTAQRIIALMSLLLLVACSHEKTTAISIRMSGQPPATVITTIQQIAKSLKYQVGIITPKDRDAVVVLEQETGYLFYFVNEESRTSIRAEVPKADAVANVTFAEFGVEEFSQRGVEQYHRLLVSLASAFGENRVVPRNASAIGL